MGIERLQDDDDPSQRADAALPKDAGHPGEAARSGEAGRSGEAERSGEAGRPEDAGRSEDAGHHSGDTYRSGDSGRSGEADRSGEVPRSGEPPPEGPARESPETTDLAVKRAESRSRSEYADDIAPPGSSPIDGDPPKHGAEERDHPQNEHRTVTHPKDEALEGGQETKQQTVPEDSSSSHDPRPNSDYSHSEPAEEADGKNGTTSDEQEDSSTNPADDHHSFTDDPDTGSGLDVADSRSDNSIGTNDRIQDGDGSDELPREAINTLPTAGAPRDGLDDKLAASSEDTALTKDRPRLLTDAEWVDHNIEIRDGLTQAESQGLTPERMHTINGAGEIWTDERELLHYSILESLYSDAAEVPCNFKAIMAGGLGGAGKTTVLTEHANIDLSQYLMINPDTFKEEMARRGMIPEIQGLSPMEAADLVHEESSYLALQLASRAQAEGKNVIWDITMSTEKSTATRIHDLRAAGYNKVEGLFVDIPIETSVTRTESRHREGHENYRAGEGLGGRYVPPEVIRRQEDPEWGSRNRRTFERLKDNFDHWSIYDNSVDGRPATIIDSSRRKHAG